MAAALNLESSPSLVPDSTKCASSASTRLRCVSSSMTRFQNMSSCRTHGRKARSRTRIGRPSLSFPTSSRSAQNWVPPPPTSTLSSSSAELTVSKLSRATKRSSPFAKPSAPPSQRGSGPRSTRAASKNVHRTRPLRPTKRGGFAAVRVGSLHALTRTVMAGAWITHLDGALNSG